MPYTANTKWSIDEHSSDISFVVNHLMISTVKGNFKKFNASVYTNGNDFTSAKIDFWLDPASINTGDSTRDENLIGKGFFDIANHRIITFVSDMFKHVGPGVYELYGNLTIKGIAKRVKLTVEFQGFSKDDDGNDTASFTLSGSLNRKNWKLDWDVSVHAGSILVSDEVLIHCNVVLLKDEMAIEQDAFLQLDMEKSSAPAYMV